MSEETLDPKDWDSLKALGHQIVDDMIDYLKNIREKPIWQQPTEEIKKKFQANLPKSGENITDIYQEIKDNVIPYGMGNIHPRFWGWVIGSGSFSGALADFIASSINYNSGGFNHSATYMENQVIDWAKEMFGFDSEASGLITTGGSMANLIGLVVARNTKAGYDIRKEGLQSSSNKLTFYGSNEMHSSILKAIELFGIGDQYLRKISVNDSYEINCDELEKSINDDIKKGFKPICIIGNLGTVNTGAVDDLGKLSSISKKYDLWLHVDGAFGALTKISPESNYLAKNLELADSIAFDFHKWMYINYEAGGILVKRKSDHLKALSLTADYIAHSTRGLHASETWFADYGIQLSRSFKALKIWTLIKEQGIEKFGRLVQQNINQANYLASLIMREKSLELSIPVSMNIVCFRFKPDNIEMTQEQLNKINEEILWQLHEKGIAIPSYTNLKGNYVIRVAITNHRSRKEDFELLISSIIELGNQIAIL
ncbi:MAG: L-2,4-diaminobutyrate decarboxylase [Candidatus Heimdallarchaeota archaeon LC_3]|nr:MAG: L-2,4-diaminobutyrate decarboxylase [Candidatus Heimdallarchaeota archaeon LC_3]